MLPLHVFDFVIDALDQSLGSIPPEQGGALLGLPGEDVVTSFVHDAGADVTGVEYRNTRWLLDTIAQLESTGLETFKGIAHSHPARTPRPSGQDRWEFATALRDIPDLGRYLAPIVTHDLGEPLQPHELATRAGARISFFAATRDGELAHLSRVRPRVVPLRAALAAAGLPFTGARVESVDGVLGVVASLPPDLLGPGHRLFATAHFPFAAPTLIQAYEGGTEAEATSVPWDMGVPPLERLARGLEALRNSGAGSGAGAGYGGEASGAGGAGGGSGGAEGFGGQGGRDGSGGFGGPDGSGGVGHQGGAGVPGGPNGTGGLGASGGADSFGGQGETGAAYRHVPAAPPRQGLLGLFGITTRRRVSRALFERTGGLLSPALRDQHVLLVGAGSVGSYLADVLVRSGVGRLTLVDPDRVEPANLGRALYGAGDIGRPKVKATARRLRAINPRVRVRTRRSEVARLNERFWSRTLPGTDLVIAATDDNAAQQRLNHLAYWFGRPAVFPGLYTGASGGEVVFTAPGLPCWACSTGGVRETLSDLGFQPATDYGTGRLVAVPGLLPDIQHAASAAAKIALALLHPDEGEERVSRFLRRPLQESLPLVLLAMEPDHWFFPGILGHVPGQYAYQSVWPRTAPREDCRVCGPRDDRTDPFSYWNDAGDADQTEQMRRALLEKRAAQDVRA